MKPIRLLLLLLLTLAIPLSAATITVTGTGDTAVLDGACTLREALYSANANNVPSAYDCAVGTPGLDQIHFAIGGGGPQLITALSPLPPIAEPVTIDGTTQPGFAGTPLVRITAAYVFNNHVFEVRQTAGGSTFRALIVSNPNAAAAIALHSSGNLVAGNYFGMIDGSTPASSGGAGVEIVGFPAEPASNNTIGGVTPADRNVFGGLGGIGVRVGSSGGPVLSPADGNVIAGNYFGWNAAKTASIGGLDEGIVAAGATNTQITGNAIVGSLKSGITMVGVSGTLVQSNDIGSLNGAVAPNRFGISIYQHSNGNTIGAATSGGPGGNVIVNNGTGLPEGAGVAGFQGTGTRISGNSMSFNAFGSSFMGIDLLSFGFGPNPNDACDGDAGANLLQNKPVITGAVHSGGMVTIAGTLNSVPSLPYTIEVYGNPPAAGDQGQQYLGAINVTTSASCQATFAGTFAFVPPLGGSTITATAIDAANNTSEMSAPAFIVAAEAPGVSKDFEPDAVPVGTETRLTIALTNPNAAPITGVAFNDNYPAGLQNAAVPNVTNSCGGTVTALPGGSSLSLSGGTIPANGTCSVSVSVVPAAPGTFVNDIPAGAVTSANAPPSDAAATATVTVGAAANDVPLSPAALALLAFALAMTGIIVSRQLGGE
jgi:hypothetical protein